MTSSLNQLGPALADRYRIEREVGQGGMATVYLAHDVRHDRKVALKVLRPELSAVIGAERFLAEIKTMANLQHPHILPLFDSGQVDGTAYYVMPFVEGESLRDRLDRDRQLSIPEAIRITSEIAAALDYAHRHNVIHRDIKPENILLQEGSATLADFGIALAVNQAGGNRLTETGLSLGTPQYMSPEQATGDRQLDARSDIYSLGAVLYEMLAGEPPHSGPTAQAVIAKLMTERPTRLRTVRDTVPEGVEAAVITALAKTPIDRFSSAGEFAAALGQPASVPASQRRRRPWLAVAIVILVALGAAVGYRFLGGPPPLPAIGRSDQLTAEPGLEIQPALSPDGRLVAYAAGGATRMRIFVRPVGGGRTIPLSDDSSAVETMPQWSPDGTRLLFLTRGGAAIAPALGGSSRPAIPPSDAASVTAATWSPDGRAIAFVRGDSLSVSPVDGGATRLVATSADLHSCRWSPGGQWIACVSQNGVAVRPGATFGNIAPSAILLFPAGGGPPVPLAEPRAFNQSPVFAPDGRHLFYVSNKDGPRDVYAVEVTSSGRPRGEPVRLTTGLGASAISISADGRRLTYAVYTARANIWSLPIVAGPPVGLDAATQITSGNQVIESMRVSRDGRWLVYDSDLRGNADIYRIPVGGGTPEQLTSDPADEFAPDLSPDGRSVAYHSGRLGTRDIEVKPLDGGAVEPVTASAAQESYPVWSPDGDAILFMDQVSLSMQITRRGADQRWSPPVVVIKRAQRGAWSPDGRSISYTVANDIASAGPIRIVGSEGGEARELFRPTPSAPPAGSTLWGPDGRTIFYKAHDAFGRASFWTVSAAGGRPRPLARLTDPTRQSSRLDFATDGKRLYFAIEDRQSDVFVAELIVK